MIIAYLFIHIDLVEKEKRKDPVFNHTIDSTLDRDMLELEAETKARQEIEQIEEVNESEDSSDDDMTLDKTIVLSSGSSLESPRKSRRSFIPSRSPMKVIKQFY